MDINESNQFTFEDLDNWGLLLKAKIEQKKDIILKKESIPNKKDLLNIEFNWREKYKLSKEEDFKIWLDKANLTKERLIYLLTRNWK